MFSLDILFLVVKLYLFNSIQVNYYHLCCCNMQISSDLVYVVILDLIHDMLWTEVPFIFSIEEKILNLYSPVKTDLLWDAILLINGIGFVKDICIIYIFSHFWWKATLPMILQSNLHQSEILLKY